MTTSTSTSSGTKKSTEKPPRERKAEQLTDQSFNEVIVELTGFEEIAIRKRYDLNLVDLMQDDFSMAQRAVGYVLYKRAGNSETDAYNAVMGMPLNTVRDLFADSKAAGDPDDESSDAGKDD